MRKWASMERMKEWAGSFAQRPSAGKRGLTLSFSWTHRFLAIKCGPRQTCSGRAAPNQRIRCQLRQRLKKKTMGGMCPHKFQSVRQLPEASSTFPEPGPCFSSWAESGISLGSSSAQLCNSATPTMTLETGVMDVFINWLGESFHNRYMYIKPQ